MQYGGARGLDYKTACHNEGLLWGLWDHEPNADRGAYAASFGLDLYIAQAEQANDGPDVAVRRGWDAYNACQAVRVADPSVPLAWVTDLGPSRADSSLDAAMQALGVAILVECYLPDNPAATPEVMVDEAHRRGYDDVVCVPGVYYGFPLATYRDQHGVDRCCVYTSEYLTAADWAVYGGSVISRTRHTCYDLLDKLRRLADHLRGRARELETA